MATSAMENPSSPLQSFTQWFSGWFKSGFSCLFLNSPGNAWNVPFRCFLVSLCRVGEVPRAPSDHDRGKLHRNAQPSFPRPTHDQPDWSIHSRAWGWVLDFTLAREWKMMAHIFHRTSTLISLASYSLMFHSPARGNAPQGHA